MEVVVCAHPAPPIGRLARSGRLRGRRVEPLGQQPPQLARAEPGVHRVLARRELGVLFHKTQQNVQLFRAHSTSRQYSTHRYHT